MSLKETSKRIGITEGQSIAVGLLSCVDDVISAVSLNLFKPNMALDALTRFRVNNSKDVPKKDEEE